MKVLYIDVATDGHHQTYLDALTRIPGQENVLVLPQKLPGFPEKQYVFQSVNFVHKKLPEFLRWTKEIQKIIAAEQPDIVHFLYGDVFYKFFGLGLEGLKKKYRVVNTIHWLKKGKIGLLSLARIASLSTACVFHTESITDRVKAFGISNAVHIEYPHFSADCSVDREIARQYFGINSNRKVLACIGGTRRDKGLDILLTALQTVKSDFELLIAGAEQGVNREEIETLSAAYWDKVHLQLRYLTDEEIAMALQAADIIVLPYRKAFDGASGPLGEGANRKKMIIGPNHGSLGRIIRENHLGITFETENHKSLSAVLEQALTADFSYDETALQYAHSLSPTLFQKRYEELYLKL